MKIVTIVCNVILSLFTCLVLATDGIPKDFIYIIFSLLLVLVPILSAVVISQSKADNKWPGLQEKKEALTEQRNTNDKTAGHSFMRVPAMIGNLVVLGAACLAIADQYPHPEEDGVLLYGALVILTPILSLVVMFRHLKAPLVSSTP
jgi:hypothetical protein